MNSGKSRYCFNPMTAKRIGRRTTLMDMIRRRRAQKQRGRLDVFMVTGFYPATFSRH